MTDTNILFPILRFVALVAPAIAILMQLMENAGESNSPAFRFLEIAIVVIMGGAIIILTQLLVRIENSTTQLGIFLIFFSLILLSMGIAWRAVPFTDDLALSISSVGDLLYYTKEIIGRLIAFSILFTPAMIFYLYFESFSSDYLQVGNIVELGIVDTHVAFSVILCIFSFRLLLYLLNTDYLTKYTLREVFYEAIISTIAGYVVIAFFILPPFIGVHFLSELPQQFIEINPSGSIFALIYVWVVFIIFVFYGVDLWAEKEDYSRFAVDD